MDPRPRGGPHPHHCPQREGVRVFFVPIPGQPEERRIVFVSETGEHPADQPPEVEQEGNVTVRATYSKSRRVRRKKGKANR